MEEASPIPLRRIIEARAQAKRQVLPGQARQRPLPDKIPIVYGERQLGFPLAQQPRLPPSRLPPSGAVLLGIAPIRVASRILDSRVTCRSRQLPPSRYTL